MKIRHSGSSLLMIELLFALLFFSLASGITIRLFVKASLLSSETVAANKAVVLAESIEEEFRNSDVSAGNIYYDKKWTKTNTSDGASYQVSIRITEVEDPTCTVSVTRLSDKSTILTLSSLKHERRKVS